MQRNEIINLVIGYVVAIIFLLVGFECILVYSFLATVFIFVGIFFLLVSARRFYLTYKKYKKYTTQTDLIEDIENLGKEIIKE